MQDRLHELWTLQGLQRSLILAHTDADIVELLAAARATLREDCR